MSYQLEYRHLRYFLAVAEDLHFRKASERLFISQPGLSKQIKELEDHLGVQLLERHSRKVSLTPSGSYLKEELKRSFQNLDYILEHSKLLDRGMVGNLKLGYVGSAMQHIIPNLLLKFKKQHPKILFNLKEMDNQAQVEGLLSNEIDLAFVRLENFPRGLKANIVLRESFCLVLPENHPIGTHNFKSLAQFKNESFILFDQKYSPSYFYKVMQLFDDSGFQPKISHNTIHSNTIYKLVENYFGISIIPNSLKTDINQKVKFIDLDYLPHRTKLSVVWNQNNRNPALQNILELITTSSDIKNVLS